MTAALLPLLALLAAAEAEVDPAAAAPAPIPAPDLTLAPAPEPAFITGSEPEPGAAPDRPAPRRQPPVLLGLGYGPSRGGIDGLRLDGQTLNLSVDASAAVARYVGGARLAMTAGWYRTPAGLDVSAWRFSGAVLWLSGPLRAGVGAGYAYSTFEKALGRGHLASLAPFACLFAGLEAGPFDGVLPYVELEGAGEFGLWIATLRAGLRFDLVRRVRSP